MVHVYRVGVPLLVQTACSYVKLMIISRSTNCDDLFHILGLLVHCYHLP